MYNSASQTYKNPNYDFIEIQCIHINAVIAFSAYLTNFSNDKNSSWNSQTVMNKMDPIYTFKNTTSKLSVGFSVPSMTLEEAISNYKKIQYFLDSLYPLYEEGGIEPDDSRGTAIVNTPPLYKIKVANWTGEINVNSTHYFGWIDSLKMDPDFNAGVFGDGEEIFPKLFKVSLTLNIMHNYSQVWTTTLKQLDTAVENAVALGEQQNLTAARGELAAQEALKAEAEKAQQLKTAEEQEAANQLAAVGEQDKEFKSFIDGNIGNREKANLSNAEITGLFEKWKTFDKAHKKRNSEGRKALRDDLIASLADEKDVIAAINPKFQPPPPKKAKTAKGGKS